MLQETFFGQSRIGNDSCGITQEDIQNQEYSNYLMKSFAVCGMRKQIEFATNYKSMNFSAAGGMGNQCDVGGCNIDTNTNLWGVPTQAKSRLSLVQRPFLTVPYLGRGPGDPMTETILQQPDMVTNRKSVNNSTEISYMPLQTTPLLPSIQKTISNPKYLVEGAADASWVRGGIPSRELTRTTVNNNNS